MSTTTTRCAVSLCGHLMSNHKVYDDPRGVGCLLCGCENFAVTGVHVLPRRGRPLPSAHHTLMVAEPVCEMMRDLLEELGPCDHETNICECGSRMTLEGLERLTRDLRRALGETPTKRDTELDVEDARVAEDQHSDVPA